MQWISIFDRYPPEGQEILAIANDGFLLLGEFYLLSYCRTSTEDHSANDCACCISIYNEDIPCPHGYPCSNGIRIEFCFKGWRVTEYYNCQSVFPPILYWISIPPRPSNAVSVSN